MNQKPKTKEKKPGPGSIVKEFIGDNPEAKKAYGKVKMLMFLCGLDIGVMLGALVVLLATRGF